MSGDQPISPETDALVGQAVDSMFAGGIVTRYVLVAEVIVDDGSRDLVTIVDDNATTWDVLGLMGLALARAQARVTASTIAGELGD